MSRHRAKSPRVIDVIEEVRSQLSDREIVQAALALTVGDEAYRRNLTCFGRPVRLENRGPDARLGRFGGGWQTIVGIQTGRAGLKGTIIVNLGKGSIRIDAKRPE